MRGSVDIITSLGTSGKASAADQKKCPHCRHENRLSAKVCTQCGHAFQALPEAVQAKREKICPRCGTICRLEAKVCTHCGHQFSTDFRPVKEEEPAAAKPAQLPDDPAPGWTRPVTDAASVPVQTRDLKGIPAPDITPQELDAMRQQLPPEPEDWVTRLLKSFADYLRSRFE